MIGVTNIIPFFGPYLGAIPCTIMILLVDPIKGFYFVIFILILQQFDGNILGPKILGDSTGLSSFMVIVAIMIGGGLFGIIGMIVGVPVCAVIYASIWKLLGHSLDEKQMPSNVEAYCEIDCLDPDTNQARPMPKESDSRMQELKRMKNPDGIFMKIWNFLWKFFMELWQIIKLCAAIIWKYVKKIAGIIWKKSGSLYRKIKLYLKNSSAKLKKQYGKCKTFLEKKAGK